MGIEMKSSSLQYSLDDAIGQRKTADLLSRQRIPKVVSNQEVSLSNPHLHGHFRLSVRPVLPSSFCTYPAPPFPSFV